MLGVWPSFQGTYHRNLNRVEFIDNNPNATAKDIFQFAGKMMDEYGLNNLPIHPYHR